MGSATLRNGTVVQTPLNGYQLIPLQSVQTGAGSEDSAWLQGSTNCLNAELSSNDYFTSDSYMSTLRSTQSFYDGLLPMINNTFNSTQTSFKNAYTIFDLLNVASIHNGTDDFSSAQLLTPETFFQVRTRADQHEFGLAYNESEPIRAITGSIVAAQVIEGLNSTISGKGKTSQLNIQFGAYGGMQSYFGQANLTSVNTDFYGVPDYASTLTWELVTNATVSSSSWPTEDQISVRFLFHNGTTSNISTPTEYPLFGSGISPMPWTDFVTGMNKFAVSSQADWCKACGNSTGVCSSESLGTSTGSASSSSSSSNSKSGGGGGISNAVAGVIGAMVTLAVILGLSLLILLIGGLRVVSKKRLAANAASPTGSAVKA